MLGGGQKEVLGDGWRTSSGEQTDHVNPEWLLAARDAGSSDWYEDDCPGGAGGESHGAELLQLCGVGGVDPQVGGVAGGGGCPGVGDGALGAGGGRHQQGVGGAALHLGLLGAGALVGEEALGKQGQLVGHTWL